MFSFKCLWTKGQKKVLYDLMHSCLRSVTRWPQTVTQRSLHSAGQDSLRGNPTCQGASGLSEARGLCQWRRHQNIWGFAISVQTSVIALGSSGAHRIAHRGWLQHGWGHPCAFPAVPGGAARSQFWGSKFAAVRAACKDPKASQFVTRTNAPSGTPLMLIKHCLIKNKLFLRNFCHFFFAL